MDGSFKYLFYLVLFYLAIFFVLGIAFGFEWFSNLVKKSCSKGSIWIPSLGAAAFLSPILPPVFGILFGAEFWGYDYDRVPGEVAFYGILFGFPSLWIVSFVFMAMVQPPNSRGSGSIDLVSPSSCRTKRDLESLMLCVSRKLEKLLGEWYGAEGKGLHEKMTSVEREIDPADAKSIRYLASVRNQVTHDDDFDPSTVDRVEILSTAMTVAQNLAKPKGVNVGLGFISWLDQIPVLRAFSSAAAFSIGLFHGVGWLCVWLSPLLIPAGVSVTS